MSQIIKVLSGSSGPSLTPVFFPESYPYTTPSSGGLIVVDSSLAPVTVNLISNPVTGTSVIIKDGSGMAGSNTITIDGNGNTIDSMNPSFISTNWGFLQIIFNGSEWNIIGQ